MEKIIDNLKETTREQLVAQVYLLNRKVEDAQDEADRQESLANRCMDSLKQLLFLWYPEADRDTVLRIFGFYDKEVQIALMCALLDWRQRGEITVFDTEVKRTHFRKLCVLMNDHDVENPKRN